MARSPAGALFCDNIGQNDSSLNCCYPDEQGSQQCLRNFGPNVDTFFGVCPDENCIAVCSDATTIYQSVQQNRGTEGDGSAPINRYQTCVNVPSMAGYMKQGILNDRINSTIAKYLSPQPSEENMRDVTNAVTDCLTSTCRFARRTKDCRASCSAVNMLINNTTPNVAGINDCLNTLCTGKWNSLPYADADVVGIGVFASYIMQCILVVLLFFGLIGFEAHSHYRRKHPKPAASSPQPKPERSTTTPTQSQPQPASQAKKSKLATHRGIFENVLIQFHQAQCYFSATLQIASLSYGIFSTNMLITFMLTPLATNGVLPVIFAYIMLLRCGKATPDITLLTALCWLLSTIVYWSLYSSIIPINSEIRSEELRYRAYQQFMYKLSAIEACGGYSALAVCPDNFQVGKDQIRHASRRLRVLTPIIWAFSTACLLGALGIKLKERLRHRADRHKTSAQGKRNEFQEGMKPPEKEEPPNNPLSGGRMDLVYYVIVLGFLAGIGMQLSLLSIYTSLKMMNRKNWSFGQIVAVTIWAPAVLGYAYDEGCKLFGYGQKEKKEEE